MRLGSPGASVKSSGAYDRTADASATGAPFAAGCGGVSRPLPDSRLFRLAESVAASLTAAAVLRV